MLNNRPFSRKAKVGNSNRQQMCTTVTFVCRCKCSVDSCLCEVRVSVDWRSHYTLRKAAFNSVFPYLICADIAAA